MVLKICLLELKGGKFYVGQSGDPGMRFDAHLVGKGASWTLLHKPVCIQDVQEIEVQRLSEAMLYENWITLQAMERFGWEKVRAGDYLGIDPDLIKEKLLPIYDCGEDKIRYFTGDNRHLLFGKSEDWLVYALELCEGHYYIGSCKHLGKALGAHFSGMGIGWTQQYAVVRVLEVHVLKRGDGHYLTIDKRLLLAYISSYGWENVLGGSMPKNFFEKSNRGCSGILRRRYSGRPGLEGLSKKINIFLLSTTSVS